MRMNKANILSHLFWHTILLRTAKSEPEGCVGEMIGQAALDLPSMGFNCVPDGLNFCYFNAKPCYFWQLKEQHKNPPTAFDFYSLPCSRADPGMTCWIVHLDWRKKSDRKAFPVQFLPFGKPNIVYCNPETATDSYAPRYLETQAKAFYGERAQRIASCLIDKKGITCQNFTTTCSRS